MFDIAEGLRKKQLCLVGTFSADLYALQQSSQKILATTIQDTVAIFMVVFNQGLQEGSLSVTERSEENAYAFFFLLGAQISVWACGSVQSFYRAMEALNLQLAKVAEDDTHTPKDTVTCS